MCLFRGFCVFSVSLSVKICIELFYQFLYNKGVKEQEREAGGTGGKGPQERTQKDNMDEIKDIYNRELYQPFVEYCAAHGYRTMRDLGCYDFRLLGRREDFSPMLITRIKAVYAAYQKTATEKAEASAPRRRSAQAVSLVMETQLLLQMREFLQSNSNRIVTLDELFRAINGQLKRTRIVKLLTDAPWCVQVDRGTYYWNGTSGMVEEQVAKVSMG